MKTGLVVLIVVVIAILAVGGYLIAKNSSHGTSVGVTYTSTVKYSTSVETTVPSTIVSNKSSSTASTSVSVTSTVHAANTSYTVSVMNSASIGNYLVNASGFTLYYNKNDVQNAGTSVCNGGCASAWPPFYVSTVVVPSSLSSNSFGTMTRNDGTKQLTYDGYPLYRFAGDTSSGQTNGQGLDNVWYAVPIPGNP